MRILLRIYFVLIAFSFSWAHASTLRCDYFFTSHPVSAEILLDRAGQLEAHFKRVLEGTYDPVITPEASRRSVELESIINDLLAEPRPEDLPYIVLQLQELSRPIGKSVSAVENLASKPLLRDIVESKDALKDIERLQPHIKKKYQMFIEQVTQVSKLADLPAAWALERVRVTEITSGIAYTVRLNIGYRVLFGFDSNNNVQIYRISMKVTHDGH